MRDMRTPMSMRNLDAYLAENYSDEFLREAAREYELARIEGRAFREKDRLRNRRKRLRKKTQIKS